MQIDEIQSVCFVGAGTMGCYNSLLSGIAGYDTVVHDISQEALDGVSTGQEMLGDYLIAIGTFPKERVLQGRNRIRLEPDLQRAVAKADLLSESVFEKRDLKRQIHLHLDEICPSATIQTTNTSSLLVSEIEDAVRRGDRFAAMHFHLGTPLVDVVGGPRTSSETLDIVRRFVLSLECVPFTPAKENKGYVFNNLAFGLNAAATALVAEYQEPLEDIDRAWMALHNAALGPFATMDLIGLNVYYDHCADTLYNEGDSKTHKLIIDLLQPYIARGEMGLKTGKGIYSYPDPVYGRPGFIAAADPRHDLYKVLLNGIIIRAIQLAANGIADFTAIDKIWMINLKSDCGPFGWLDHKGLDLFLTEVENETRELVFPDCDRDQIKRFLDPIIRKGQTGRNAGKGFYSYPDPVYEEAGFLLNPFQR